MVKAEDRQFENEIITGGHHIAVPLELSVTDEGIEILAYSFCMDIAREFESRFSSDPVSEEARMFLCEQILPIMEQLDYEADGDACRIHYEYRCRCSDRSRILPECKMIDTLEGVKFDESLPLDEFELDPLDPVDRMAVIARNGEIVCFAGVNDISDDGGYCELTVECAEEYRNHGYGASCVARLAEYLLSVGEKVNYICSSSNEASQKTASAAGFELYKTVMSFVCYKKEENEEN